MDSYNRFERASSTKAKEATPLRDEEEEEPKLDRADRNPVEWSAPDGRLPLQTTTLPPSSLGGTEAKFGGANSSSIELGVKTRKVVSRQKCLFKSSWWILVMKYVLATDPMVGSVDFATWL
ncbi:unnamed protein product [Microthlaspi erraticum]|uniref:Uncharacterized protein n=1 Tax=Microthlaspi erraticum TaxID=1685480 RepID=A0A6D2K692_9BRAS|nr:unnamed protein product [Microthlaspi erraticum]